MVTLRAADLFCGAGGTSTGLYRACDRLGAKLELLAVNHWSTAVETHAKNHPAARHLCASLDSLNPRDAVRGRLDLLVASPECTHHSAARGGKPMNDQSRASAWCVVRWAEALLPETILVENVREFRTWGPLGANGRPLKRRAGETFDAWIGALRSLGYTVDTRLLNAADFGEATTRTRLFVVARRGRGPVPWPSPTHARGGSAELFGKRGAWRPAREVIDWSIEAPSIFGRKRPLAPATLARIAEGLRRFGGDAAEPFLVLLRGTGTARSVEVPVPALTAGGEHVGLAQPFVLQQQSGGVARAVSEPIPTLATKGAVSLVEPFIVPFMGERDGQRPRTRDVRDPLPTVTTRNPIGLAQPFVLPVTHGRDSSRRARSVEGPLPTITSANRGELGICEPFLVPYYGTARPRDVSAPVPTLTTKDRLGLVEPGAQLDIRFRMLQPHELARAMGFPDDYRFAGNRGDVVRQIGNAVSVTLAEALFTALLAGRAA